MFVDEDSPTRGRRLASLQAPRSETETSIAVVSDPHVSTRAEGTVRLHHRTEEHLSNAIADINDRDPDIVLFTGDLTKDGGPWDFEAFDDLVERLRPPFVAIPGNHDVPKSFDEHDVLPLAEFERRYTPGGLPYVESVGDVDIVALDSEGSDGSLADDHDGRVPDEQVEWLKDVLPGTTNPIVTLHHNLPGTTAQIETYLEETEDMAIPNELLDAEALVEVLEAHDVPLVLTGHRHVPGVARTGTVQEVMAPTTCSFPQGYVYLEIGPDGTAVDFVPVADHDGMREAASVRFDGGAIARSYAALAAVRLASPPQTTSRE